MRTLTEEEEKKVMTKLQNFIGDAVKDLLEDSKLYFNNQKVLLLSEKMLKATSQIRRKEIICAGPIIGKFTKGANFRITITALHTLHKYALHKVWIKASAEMNFLYGNNALRSHVSKISESIPINAGVFVYNHQDVPLGFGLIALNNNSYQKARGGDIVVLSQADNGEYVRNETAVA
ncbi:60S ribosome subunit biogenesis protein NIP7 [Pancytospora philotis]|nr:60S ribosome subunit biogenesis protein NIP7 [Pancytospora philotis]